VLALALRVFFEAVGLAESSAGLVISHLLITIPFAFRTLLVSVATLYRRLEWSSDFLGATPTQTFLRVIAPQLKTGLIASLIFAFILSFNNVTLALFLSGFGERMLPVEMFQRALGKPHLNRAFQAGSLHSLRRGTARRSGHCALGSEAAKIRWRRHVRFRAAERRQARVGSCSPLGPFCSL
jgi:ABC-type spermidine/putrescine transport system permease subunit II